jgi:Asp-tRNA(Asn)/Glu-tRNA(Gln) amidotransferase C subunit
MIDVMSREQVTESINALNTILKSIENGHVLNATEAKELMTVKNELVPSFNRALRDDMVEPDDIEVVRLTRKIINTLKE